MRKLFLFSFFLVLVLPAALSAQPKLKIVEGLQPDFGVIYTNQPLHRSIHVVNEGTDTLKISGVSASCGCTSALLSSDRIPPKGKGEIGITFNPEKFAGLIKKAISFETNDPKNQQVHIDFTVLVDKVITVDAEYLTYPGAMVDSQSVIELVVKNLGKKPVTITGVKTTSPFMTVDPSQTTIDPDGEIALQCILAPKQRGILRGDITINTDNALVPSLTTKFFALVKAPKGGDRQ